MMGTETAHWQQQPLLTEALIVTQMRQGKKSKVVATEPHSKPSLAGGVSQVREAHEGFEYAMPRVLSMRTLNAQPGPQHSMSNPQTMRETGPSPDLQLQYPGSQQSPQKVLGSLNQSRGCLSSNRLARNTQGVVGVEPPH